MEKVFIYNLSEDQFYTKRSNIICDIDGTLLPVGKDKITNKKVFSFIHSLKQKHNIYFLSNNIKKQDRTEKLAKSFDVSCLKINHLWQVKPSPLILNQIKEQHKMLKLHIIGDWYFQEGVLAKLSKAKFTWVKPFSSIDDPTWVKHINMFDDVCYNVDRITRR